MQSFDHQHVTHEGALRSAFQTMLADTARTDNWTLVPELATKAGGKRVVPDGTMRDSNSLPRGYWEAKDTGDDLDTEITKKSKKGYPLTNTIFEDTREAVLFQNKNVAMRVQLTDPKKLADLREERELRQTDVAEKLGVSQANVSRVEGQDDVYLSTLRRYVEALGGALEINAVFPDQRITLTYPNEPRRPDPRASRRKSL